MSGPEISNQDNFEDFLLSNQFYVGPSNSRNHIANLRKSVQIPNSISNTSIHAGLANDPMNANQQRTSIMKVSPSMKALESILSEKNNTAPIISSDRIVEEDEEQTQFPVNSGLSVNYTTEDPNRGSTYSVQTFETAHSDNSFSDTINMNTNESIHKSQKSISTIDDGYNTNDDTPVLVNPAQFQTFTQVNGSNKNLIHPIRVVHESSVEDLDGQSTDVSNGSLDNKDIEQDDTLVGNEGVLKNQYEQQQQKFKQKQKELLEEQRIQEQLEQKEREIQELKKQKEAQEQRKQKELLEQGKKNQNQHKHQASNQASSMLLPETGKVIKKPGARQLEADSSINNTVANPEPLKKSPHTRSNSTFSLSFTKNKEQPPLPGKHKRSSTFSDLSAVSKGMEKLPTTKKFSFKNLFKSKSKVNKNQEDDLVSKPRKLSSKSYSSSNIATHGDESNASEGWKKFSTTNKNKGNEKVVPGSYDKQSPLPQPPQQDRPPHKPSISSSTSLLSVFKKDKVSDNSSKLIKSENQEQASKKAKPNQDDSEQVVDSTSNLLNKEPSNPMHYANFIREVNDDDYNPNTEYPTPIITESNYDTNMKDYNNDNNMIGDSRVFKSKGTDASNNDLLMPEGDALLNNDSLFGSPFKVDYKPSTNTPKLEAPHDKLAILSEEDRPKNKSDVNDQLLGETLFPKSLNAQEVESIVSLERSRSMRSIKSNKRNSFVNYDGSDDNIIQYDGTRTSSPNLDTVAMGRSNSILKNSNSKKNLNVENMNSINAQMLNDESIDNYDDLIEFTDYIDLDNLDFSISPKEIVEKSPVIMSSSPSLLSEKFDQFQQKNQQPLINENDQNQFNSTSDKEFDSSSIQEIPPPVGYVKSSDAPPIILSTPPPSHDDPKQQILLSKAEEEQVKVPVEDIDSNEPVKGPLTPNLETINANQIPESPESINDLPESNDFIEKSPILGTAYQNSPMINENGKNVMNNRPISMSFRGLKGPSFGGKLAMHNLRSSDSHQSFNMSFGDEEEEDEENEGPVSEVGGGFGSSDDEDDDSFDGVENKENDYRNPLAARQQVSSKFGQENNFSQLAPPNPLPMFTHNKIPLISSNSSSPKSFSSMFSRKFKKSPTIQSSARAAAIKDGVRFSSRIILYDTYNCDEYDRHPDNATCNQLTPALAQQIKDELNEFKSEMSIHEHSRCHTHFF
mmetsp:Transcript_6283/g.7780  ORF Transcript_6283/g.7780 Transcript_6283/m.7780 type:complete len:1188 (+) Transcript_6283:5243-8806(+)